MLGPPELDAGLQVGSDESGVKGQNPLPRPAAHAALDAAQDTVGFPGCIKNTYTHINENLQSQLRIINPLLGPSTPYPALTYVRS